MRRRTKSLKDYLWSMGAAFFVALIFTFAVPVGAGPGARPPIGILLLVPLISGTFFGNAFFFLSFVMPKLRFQSFILTSLARSGAICVVLVVGLLLLVPTYISLFSHPHVAPWSPVAIGWLAGEWRSGMLFKWMSIGIGTSFLFSALHQIDRKLGPGVALNWITGKYHSPKEEERIFMFLDLKHSTTLAEKLGNIRFSKLCQDFFLDLTKPVEETQGEVSHYIGDEAVLTWKPRKGLDEAHCIRCFYLMREAIDRRAAHYQTAYGITPEFKAGVHIGPVVAAEVGEIKSEIVYHGDVLNTTARITGLCSDEHSDLLISGDLLRRLVLPEDLHSHSLGPRLLKGKEHEVEIIAIATEPFHPAREVAAQEQLV